MSKDKPMGSTCLQGHWQQSHSRQSVVSGETAGVSLHSHRMTEQKEGRKMSPEVTKAPGSNLSYIPKWCVLTFKNLCSDKTCSVADF